MGLVNDTNSWLLNAILVAERVCNGIRGRVFGWSCGFGPGFIVAGSPRIIGGRRMRVGRNFRAGKMLWLETISRFQGVDFTPQLDIADDVGVNDFVHIACAKRVTIGKGVLMASRIYISDHGHGAYRAEEGCDPSVPPTLRPLHIAPVSIGDNVWLGEGVCVLPGVTIGAGSVIGANSVVTKSLPENCVAAGCPARIVRLWNPSTKRWEHHVS